MEIPAITIAIIIAATIAIVKRVKAEAPPLADYIYTLMAFAVGAGVYAIAAYAPVWAQTIFIIGLAASGVYDIFKSKTS